MYSIGEGSASCVDIATVHHKDCHLLPPDSTCICCTKWICHRFSVQIHAKRSVNQISAELNHQATPTIIISVCRSSFFDWNKSTINASSSPSSARHWRQGLWRYLREMVWLLTRKDMKGSRRSWWQRTACNVLQSLPPNFFQVSTCIAIHKILQYEWCPPL